jgi:hypothetical protein
MFQFKDSHYLVTESFPFFAALKQNKANESQVGLC